MIQNSLTAARELSDLKAQSGYTNTALAMTSTFIGDLETAATRELNEENWPTIKQLILSVGRDAGKIADLCGYKLDQKWHDKLVRRVAAIPAELDEYLERLQNDQSHGDDLKKLAHELRMIAFHSLVPEHPQFAARLKDISLNLRRHVLWSAKNTPRKAVATSAVQDIREQLAQLIAKYIPSLYG